jgi:hypothetical protein
VNLFSDVCSLPAPRTLKIVKESGREIQDQTGAFPLKARFVRFHGTVERGKLRILSESLGKDTVSLCVPVTANALASGNCIGDYDRHVAIGPCTNFLAMLVPIARNSAASR